MAQAGTVAIYISVDDFYIKPSKTKYYILHVYFLSLRELYFIQQSYNDIMFFVRIIYTS